VPRQIDALDPERLLHRAADEDLPFLVPQRA
jgi:hypothetical protein